MMLTLNVSGMACAHCSQSVVAAVKAVPGVADVAVDLSAGKVTVTGETDEAAIRQAIEDAGYEPGATL